MLLTDLIKVAKRHGLKIKTSRERMAGGRMTTLVKVYKLDGGSASTGFPDEYGDTIMVPVNFLGLCLSACGRKRA